MNHSHGHPSRAGVQAVLVGLLVFCTAICASGQDRVVAVGDVHGDLSGFVRILQHAKLVDGSRNWNGGAATLVQCGDSIDRGPDMRGVLDFLMALEKQAPKKGGRAIALLGNHEAMNIYGDVRYVTPENFASFADGDSEKRRSRAWEQYVEWRQKRAQARNQPAPEIGAAVQQEWLAAHPLGFLEHREAFGPNGKYGKWLRDHDAVLQIGSTAFLHGGISPEIASWKFEDLNKRIRKEFAAFDSYRQAFVEQGLLLPFFTLDEIAGALTTELNNAKQAIEIKKQEAVAAGKAYEPSVQEKKFMEPLEVFLTFPAWLSINPAGPLWFRGYSAWTDAEGPANLEMLSSNGITQYVVGHTPQMNGIRARFDNRVFLIDTGLLSSVYKGGVASALEISNGKFTAIYEDRRVALSDVQATGKTAPVQKEPDALPREDQFGELGGGQAQGQPDSQGDRGKAANGAATASTASRAAPVPTRVWLGMDGNPLPLQNDQQVMDFLQTATVKSWKDVGSGINNPKKVLLEKDGLQIHAVFREVDVEKNEAKMASGQREMFFRDSYVFEIAAYRLAKMLGLDNVPPVVKRKMNGVTGSMQLWVEGTLTETKRQQERIRPPDVLQWNRQVQIMHAFDALIYNTDRNMGNVLIDKNWKLWMIDHTRAFRRYAQLWEPETIVLINREYLQAVRALNPEAVKEALKDNLRSHEIEGILRRREAFLEYATKLIAEHGEEKTLFSWTR